MHNVTDSFLHGRNSINPNVIAGIICLRERSV